MASLTSLNSLYLCKFPLFIATSVDVEEIVDIYVEGKFKYIEFEEAPRRIYDALVSTESTYLGRLMALNRQEIPTIRYDLSFEDLAHYLYSRPPIGKNILIADSKGDLYRKAPIHATMLTRNFVARMDNYIFVKGYYSPIRIPDNPMLYEALDKYTPAITLINYQNTFFFRNIADEYRKKGRKVRIL